MSRAAVVVNPTKLDDDEAFRTSARRVKDDHDWDEPFWLQADPSGKTQTLLQSSALITFVAPGCCVNVGQVLGLAA